MKMEPRSNKQEQSGPIGTQATTGNTDSRYESGYQKGQAARCSGDINVFRSLRENI